MNQTFKVLNYMLSHKAISDKEARNELGITRLASRIVDLKEMGILIKRKMVYVTTKEGERKKWAEYWIDPEQISAILRMYLNEKRS